MCRHCIADDVLHRPVRLFTGYGVRIRQGGIEKIARGARYVRGLGVKVRALKPVKRPRYSVICVDLAFGDSWAKNDSSASQHFQLAN